VSHAVLCCVRRRSREDDAASMYRVVCTRHALRVDSKLSPARETVAHVLRTTAPHPACAHRECRAFGRITAFAAVRVTRSAAVLRPVLAPGSCSLNLHPGRRFS
jgi:hypothetical protein